MFAGFNTAVPSTSTGTFVSKGHWKKSVKIIKEEVAKARRTIVTIQFGHNDRNRGTVESMGRNLTTMVNQIKELKAEPVLVTPLVIRRFGKDGKIADELVPWAEETKTVARETKTHILDLHGASLKYCESLGDEASRRLYSGTGAVHVNNKGKIVFGRMVADLMNADFGLLGINLLPIVPNRELSYNISHGIPSY
ncbi:carbohydrate esterase family 12 protein [Moniliophthora roreri MCA 2997]|uniref:Carbohydrate esterase family 12 protein n=1 Tax=Moniliophthora roreri (strain MCA 2997) TaxID=1381753 RepID=V2YNY6_MONRO|nr:carbohydrate esterase family 12 protein [Moniliophthora roreri MCA 2997]